MQFLEKIFFPLNIKRDKQNNNLLTDIKNRSIDLLEWLKKAFPYFVNVNNGLTNTTYSGDSTSIQLGGEILHDTYVTYQTQNTDNPIGIFYLKEGIVEPNTPTNEAIFFGELPDLTNMSTKNGLSVINSDNGALGTVIGNNKAVIEVVKQPDGDGGIDMEVISPDGTITTALKMSPMYLTFGDYFNASDIYLNLDDDLGLYQIGKLNGGTHISVENLTELVKITNVPTYINDAAAATGGLTTGHLYKTTTGGITSLNIVP